MEDRIRLVGHSFAYKTGYKNGIDDCVVAIMDMFRCGCISSMDTNEDVKERLLNRMNNGKQDK